MWENRINEKNILLQGVKLLDIKRAKAIIESPNEIKVHYNGQPIWMESVNEMNSRVEIKNHKISKTKRQVSVDELVEIGEIH